MSVRKPERSTSDHQFLATARELEIKTRARCINGPKRYTFYGLQELWLTSRRIYSAIKRGNRKPETRAQYERRRALFFEACEWIEDYNSQLELLLDGDVLTPKAGSELAGLLAYERKLLTGVMKSDKARFSNLP